MKRFIKIVYFILVTTLFTCCKMSLLDKPTPEPDVILEASDYSDEISAPVDLTATQGGCKVVTLSWKALPNAVQYQIFSADTPFETFNQVAETSDNSTSIEVSEKSGITKYYKIKAVNYYGTISDFSNIVMGSTLATPVITSIESSENGTISTVNWWMENCSKSTYQDFLNYIITCYEEDGSTVVSSLTAEGAATSVTFEGLSPKTNYYFQVEAFLTGDQDNVEKSDKLDAETARRLIPKAAVEFSATQGSSADYVELSWKLPEFVDYALGKNTYEQHPVYFTIERKLMSAEDSTYLKIISYIGTVKADEDPDSDSVIQFNCADATSSSVNLNIVTGTEDSTVLYPEYIPSSELTYKDYSIERGIQYSYRITSYVDDTTKTISCDEAKCSADGWMIGLSSFNSKSAYTFDESETSIKTTSISFSAVFDALGITYKYFITEQYTPFKTQSNPYPVSETETTILTFNSIDEVCAAKKTFDCTAANLKIGNYKYRLYISNPEATDFAGAYSCTAAIGYTVVASSKSDLPQISWVEVADGYKDKFILTWEYKNTMKYSYKWIPTGQDENDVQSVDIPENSMKISDVSASFTIPVSSNDSGRFILTCTPKDGSGHSDDYIIEDTYYTLGTAVPAMNGYYYDKIQIKWPAVQRAKVSPNDYTISAWYSDDTSKKNLITAENTKLEKSGSDIICTITQPEGFNTSERSGSAIQFSVTAKSSTTDDTTTANSIIRTLGPAAVNTTEIKESSGTTTYTNANQIVMSWDEIEGISEYKILRAKYAYNDFEAVEKTDIYEITKDTNGTISVQISGENVDSTRCSVTYDSGSKKFTLVDKYQADDNNGENAYKANQSKISWGIPFGYSVFPLNSMSDVIFNLNEITLDSSSQLQLKELVPLKTATYGFGINLRAEKAVNGSKQTLTWEKPFNCNRPPFVYRREAGTTDWTYISTNIDKTSTSVSIPETVSANKSKAYEYIVSYNTNSENSFTSSFLEEQYSQMDSKSPTEPLFKGYLLALDFRVSPGNSTENSSDISTYYREKIEWNFWDYSKRAIGPSSVKIYLLNKNFADGWKEVCSLDKDCKIITQGSLNDVLLQAENSTPILYLSPEKISKNSANKLTDGDLKVLRDTKHYYKMELTNSNGKVTLGDDESIFTYRQITDNELVRCIGLIVADDFHRAGFPDRYTYLESSGERKINGNTGLFSFTYDIHSLTDYSNDMTWKYTNYKHEFIHGTSSKNAGSFVSPFSLNSSISSNAEISLDDHKLYHIPTLEIVITNDCPLASHSGTIKITAGEAKDSTVWSFTGELVNRSKISVTSESSVKEYLPLLLGSTQENGDSSLNTKFVFYQSPWYY